MCVAMETDRVDLVPVGRDPHPAAGPAHGGDEGPLVGPRVVALGALETRGAVEPAADVHLKTAMSHTHTHTHTHTHWFDTFISSSTTHLFSQLSSNLIPLMCIPVVCDQTYQSTQTSQALHKVVLFNIICFYGAPVRFWVASSPQ